MWDLCLILPPETHYDFGTESGIVLLWEEFCRYIRASFYLEISFWTMTRLLTVPQVRVACLHLTLHSAKLRGWHLPGDNTSKSADTRRHLKMTTRIDAQVSVFLSSFIRPRSTRCRVAFPVSYANWPCYWPCNDVVSNGLSYCSQHQTRSE